VFELVLTNPSVTLSPNARKRVFDSRSGGWTRTRKTQEADWFRASLAEHWTIVDPATKGDPDDGWHVVESGWTGVPTTSGASKLTGTAPRVVCCRSMSAGHESENDDVAVGAVGVLGSAGDRPEQDSSAALTSPTAATTVRQ
jgi:hypothetical protein